MTRIFMQDGVRHIIVERESERSPCELCGKVAELRPYGPNNENICIQCGRTMPEVVDKKMDERFGMCENPNPDDFNITIRK